MIRNISLATMIASLLISSIFVFAQMEEAGEAAEEITETPATLSPAVTGIIRGTIVDTTPNRRPVGGVTVNYVGT